MRKKTLTLVVICIAAACFAGSARAQSWVTLEDLPTGRSRLAVAHWNGKIFAIGGQESDIACTPRVDVYDLAAPGWSRKADAPVALCGHAAVSHEGKIYVFGGLAGARGTDRVLVYDPRNDVWTTFGVMPTRRAMHAAALAGNGMIYVFGGQDTGAALSNVDEFDPATGTWRRVAPLPAPRTALAAAADCKGTIYALGGHGPSTPQGGTTEGSLFAYDAGSDSWTALAPMPMPRGNLAAAGANDGRLYALGGIRDGFETADVQVYDVEAGTWSPGPALPTAAIDLAAVTVGAWTFALGGSSKFGGILASHHALGPVQLAAFCSPCGTGSPDHVVRGGLRDDFVPPVDPASARPALQALIPSGTAVGFDDPRPNHFVGHTLGLPKKLAFFPNQIVRAELETRMRPNASLADNDGLALGVDADGTFTFSTVIADLPEAQGRWQLGDPAAVFRLDLAALPDGSDLLPKIDAERLLDFRVQDDTTVDYVQVEVWTCPRPLVLDGTNAKELPNTTALLRLDGSLTLQPEDEGGSFGINIDMGEAEGVCVGVERLCLTRDGAIGDNLATVLSQAADGSDFELRFVQDPAGVAFVVDEDEGVKVQAGLSMGDDPNQDSILAEQFSSDGGTVAVIPAEACVKEFDWVDGRCHRIWLEEPVPVTLLPGGPTVTADVVRVCRGVVVGMEERRFSIELTGGPPMTVESVAVQQFGLFSTALGTARIEALDETLLLRELGDGGDDGIAVRLPDVESAGLDFAPLDVGEPLAVGSFLEIAAQGRFDGVDDRPLGSLRFDKTGEEEGLLVTADFAEVDSPTQRIQVLSGGTVVADLPGHLGPVGRVSEWPIGLGKLFPVDRTKCYAGDFPPDTLFSIDGVEYLGDELRVLADGADGKVGTISELSLRTAGIPEITLTGAETKRGACVPDATTLCLNDDRFEVEARWRTNQGTEGIGQAVPLTSDTGSFWFFDESNLELVVKVLDACTPFDRFWVFAAGLTNVEVELTVTDTVTGEVQTYRNPLDTPFQPIQDTDAFATCDAGGGAVRLPERLGVAEADLGIEQAALLARSETLRDLAAPARQLFLDDDRFRVEVEWETTQGTSGAGEAVPITSDTGYFWFFEEENVELVLKVLDACSFADRFWVFAGGLTNVEVHIRVTDTLAGETRTYSNPQETPFQPIQDTDAFATCDVQEPVFQWTVWLDRDDPGGEGDFELLSDFLRERPGDVCPEPVDIECRRQSDQQLVDSGTQPNGEVIDCELPLEGRCVNMWQPPGVECSDYAVRFLCPE